MRAEPSRALSLDDAPRPAEPGPRRADLTDFSTPRALPEAPGPRALRAFGRAVSGATAASGALQLEAAGMLATLHQAVLDVLQGRSPRLRAAGVIPLREQLAVVRRRFLEEVGHASERVDAGDVVTILRAVERLDAQIERDLSHSFLGRLAGPQASELLVEVAHDMRSPLGAILFLVDTLRNGSSGPLSPIQERQLGLVYSATLGLSQLAGDLTEMANGGARLLELHPVPFSVTEIMHSVRDIVQPMAEEKGLAIQLTPPETDLRVGHPAALARVLLNLTTNALKFTARGSVTVTTRTLSHCRVEFSVRDTGRGIAPETLRTLFQCFHDRDSGGAPGFSSTGLGLAICHVLVTGMGGNLRVETPSDGGTRFFFELDLPPLQKL